MRYRRQVIYLLIYLFVCLAVPGLSCGMQDLRCSMWNLLLWCTGSLVQCGLLSSCGTRALERAGSVVAAYGPSCPMACGILVPQLGIEPLSPALEGGFLTTGPPGKSPGFFFFLMRDYCPRLGYSNQECLCTDSKCVRPKLLEIHRDLKTKFKSIH